MMGVQQSHTKTKPYLSFFLLGTNLNSAPRPSQTACANKSVQQMHRGIATTRLTSMTLENNTSLVWSKMSAKVCTACDIR